MEKGSLADWGGRRTCENLVLGESRLEKTFASLVHVRREKSSTRSNGDAIYLLASGGSSKCDETCDAGY